MITNENAHVEQTASSKDTSLNELLEEAEELLRTNATTLKFRNRIAEVLIKYDIRIPQAPLDALAMAMHRMSKS